MLSKCSAGIAQTGNCRATAPVAKVGRRCACPTWKLYGKRGVIRSANGAISSQAWGNTPRIRSPTPRSAEGAIQRLNVIRCGIGISADRSHWLEAKATVNRAFSAGVFLFYQSLSAALATALCRRASGGSHTAGAPRHSEAATTKTRQHSPSCEFSRLFEARSFRRVRCK